MMNEPVEQFFEDIYDIFDSEKFKSECDNYVLPDDVEKTPKYYIEKLHSKKIFVNNRCRIRNRPNSGHRFK